MVTSPRHKPIRLKTNKTIQSAYIWDQFLIEAWILLLRLLKKKVNHLSNLDYHKQEWETVHDIKNWSLHQVYIYPGNHNDHYIISQGCRIRHYVESMQMLCHKATIRDKSSWHTCLKQVLLTNISFIYYFFLFKHRKSPHPPNQCCLK